MTRAYRDFVIEDSPPEYHEGCFYVHPNRAFHPPDEWGENGYLHSDGVIYPSTREGGQWSGYFDTIEQARAAIDRYYANLSTHDQP